MDPDRASVRRPVTERPSELWYRELVAPPHVPAKNYLIVLVLLEISEQLVQGGAELLVLFPRGLGR